MLSPRTDDLDIVRRDSGLPGLGLILDPGQMLERISRHPMLESVEELELDYVRYKPGMNCLGRYRFLVDGKPAWAYAKAFSNESRAKLDKVAQSANECGPSESSLVLPDWSVFVSFFPGDFKLRSIARLSDPDAKARLFRRVFAEPEGWVDSEAQILNYKPERRLVLRLTSADQKSATLKFHTRREFERLARVGKMFRHAPEIVMSRHIGQSRKHGCYAYEWIEGETLRSRLGRIGSALEPHREAGRLIAEFHGATASSRIENLIPAEPPELLSLTDQLGFLIPDLADEARRLAVALQDLEGANAARSRLIHGDFYDKQIIVSGDNHGLIDLDCVRLGDIHQDLACFLAHRERQILNGSASRASVSPDVVPAFLGGYVEAGGGYSEAQLCRWTAWHLLRLSHHPFRDRVPDWADQTRLMLSRAAQLLDAHALPQLIATG